MFSPRAGYFRKIDFSSPKMFMFIMIEIQIIEGRSISISNDLLFQVIKKYNKEIKLSASFCLAYDPPASEVSRGVY